MTVQTPLNQSSGQMELTPPETAHIQEEEVRTQISFWRGRIDSASKLPQYENFKKTKEAARAFYKGEIFTEAEKNNWEGDTVQANLFKRVVNFMTDSVMMQSPTIHVRSRNKSGTNPLSPQGADIIEKHLKYVFEEEDLRTEIRRIWKDAYFGNLSAAKIDFDRARGLWRAKWIAGLIVLDPDARGDVSRARWMAEMVVMPRYRVWQDQTFDPKVRQEIKGRFSNSSDGSSSYYSNDTGMPGKEDKDNEVLWYIYTKEGITPLKYGIDPDADRAAKGENSPNRLLVLCQGCDKWLLNTENPCPFLDDDEYNIAFLRLDETPGEFIGTALWDTLKAAVSSFNWAASYHMSDMRITAARAVGYDKNKIDDPSLLKSRKHQVNIPVDGPPKDVLSPLDKGQSDKTIFDSVMFFHDLVDKLSGIDEIARGEEGRTKTATESQILQQNSNITLRGPSAALDYFMNDVVRKIGLATLYYTPAFSIFPMDVPSVDPLLGIPLTDPLTGAPKTEKQFFTRQAVQMPVMDPMSGMPAVDPMTGQPAMQQQIQVIPAEGATQAVKGIDYFHGDEAATFWPVLPYDQIKSDVFFSIEAGSSRYERRQEKKQEVTELLNTLGLDLKEKGMHGELWELWNHYLDAFQIDDKSKVLPPKDQYIMLAQQAQMMMMQAEADAAANGEGGKGDKKGGKEKGITMGGDKESFSQDKNAGKTYPMNAMKGKDQSSGA